MKRRLNHAMYRKPMHGFTLIELLVVIAIIALLLSILMPSLQKVKKTAKTLICNTNLKQWGIVVYTYTMDNDDSFEMGYWGNSSNKDHGWWQALFPYYKDVPEIMYCPETKAKDIPYKNAEDITFNTWQLMAKNGEGAGYGGSYGKNSRLTNPPRADISQEYWDNIARHNTNKLTSVKNAGAVPLFFDCSWVDTCFSTENGVSLNDPPPSSGAPGTEASYRVVLNRHGGKSNGYTNVVFADGAASRVGLKELWTLKWNKNYEASCSLRAAEWPDWMKSFTDYAVGPGKAMK